MIDQSTEVPDGQIFISRRLKLAPILPPQLLKTTILIFGMNKIVFRCQCITEDDKAVYKQVENEKCDISCLNEWEKPCGGTDGHVNVYRTMLVDSRCEKIKLGRKHQFKKTMLASFPGSGNTWARYVIERATGYFTGSVANDGSLFEGGFKSGLSKYGCD